jgi:predicted small secreted protein
MSACIWHFQSPPASLQSGALMEEAMIKLRRPFAFVLLFATLAGLAACSNTIRGVGRDMHQTGHAVEDAVKGR